MTTVLRFAIPASLALGLGMLAQLLLEYVGEGLVRLHRRSRAGRLAAMLQPQEAEKKAPSEDALFGLDGVNWPLVMLVAGVIGVGLSSLVFGELAPPARPIGIVLGLLPLAVRSYLRRQGQQKKRFTVRDFAADLRLLLPLQGGLGPTLEMIAEEENGPSTPRRAPGPLAQGQRAQGRLSPGQGLIAARIRSLLGMKQPVEILDDLAAQLFSPELARLVRHIRAAIKGGESLERAVALAAEDMDAEIATAAEEAVESAPTRLIVPMAVLLLVPALILLFFPIADNLLNSLTMASGGF